MMFMLSNIRPLTNVPRDLLQDGDSGLWAYQQVIKVRSLRPSGPFNNRVY